MQQTSRVAGACRSKVLAKPQPGLSSLLRIQRHRPSHQHHENAGASPIPCAASKPQVCSKPYSLLTVQPASLPTTAICAETFIESSCCDSADLSHKLLSTRRSKHRLQQHMAVTLVIPPLHHPLVRLWTGWGRQPGRHCRGQRKQ